LSVWQNKEWMTMTEMREELDKAHDRHDLWVKVGWGQVALGVLFIPAIIFVDGPEGWILGAAMINMITLFLVTTRKEGHWAQRAKELHAKVEA
jgi:hypothetical protein